MAHELPVHNYVNVLHVHYYINSIFFSLVMEEAKKNESLSSDIKSLNSEVCTYVSIGQKIYIVST